MVGVVHSLAALHYITPASNRSHWPPGLPKLLATLPLLICTAALPFPLDKVSDSKCHVHRRSECKASFVWCSFNYMQATIRGSVASFSVGWRPSR